MNERERSCARNITFKSEASVELFLRLHMALELASMHLPDFILLLSLLIHMGHEGTVVVGQAWVVHVIKLPLLGGCVNRRGEPACLSPGLR